MLRAMSSFKVAPCFDFIIEAGEALAEKPARGVENYRRYSRR
jgi:hypothetical protein